MPSWLCARPVRPAGLPLAVLALVLLAGATGCKTTDAATRLTRELLSLPKEEAYAKGDALLAKKKWEQGRQYIRFVAENYANDPIGKQAALRLADSFFDEKTTLSYMEAQARYRDFRSRYPSHPKADYALFRLAQCADRQAEKPDRDQTNTRLAASSYREVLQAYPDSPYAAEARARYRAMRNLLAEHEFRVAHFYLRRKLWMAAKLRYDFILAGFPESNRMEQVLFEGGLAELKVGHEEDARLLWERLRRDYPKSAYLRSIPKRYALPLPEPAAGTPSGATGTPATPGL